VIANVNAGNNAAALAAIDRILVAVQSGELRQWALSARRKLEKGR
jgi:hydroxymethylglutaryl-CoA reductase